MKRGNVKSGSGRIQVVRIMPLLAVLTKNGMASPEAVQRIVGKIMQSPHIDAEQVIEYLCALDIPEEKMDVFSGVCTALRAL